ncbi:bifunctional DNA-formamidopyrimidine glycosylase/DNA-(apurinic or apyrimidinic site) lyase [Candidatus Woesebacteria bacterium]|nr:bifunctional DNA-formamidopyrimidine glycosylase/DNA-(apurinic or apyrimidinic site) lyase [Candidatus Woesebacteria bacterium]
MPELPEVETIAKRLAQVVVGQRISNITVLREKSFQGTPSSLFGATITAITRRSKILQFHFDQDNALLVHLKMTGQLIYVDDQRRVGGGHPTADWVSELPSKHTRVIFDLQDTHNNKSSLFFNDMRVFGWLKVLDAAGVTAEFAGLGPDITDSAATLAYFAKKIADKNTPIKQVIMDNSVVAGVGNIYANDALNLARINPFRPANSLDNMQVEQLYHALQTVIHSGIALGGATMENFRHIDGFSGDYQKQVLTYGREGEPCKNCAGIIIRKKQAGRSTFYCPNCQK